MKYNTLKAKSPTFCKAPVISAVALLCLLVIGGRTPLHASTGLTWDANSTLAGQQDGPGTWTTTTGSTNWIGAGGNQGWTNGDDASINGGATGSSDALTLGTNITVNNLYFASPAVGGGSSINTGAFTLTISGSIATNNGNASTISGTEVFTNGLVDSGTVTIGGASVTGGATLTISGSDSITGGILVNGNSTLNLTGTTTLSGNISVGSGYTALTLSGSVSTTSGSDNITVSAGANGMNMTSGTYAGLALGTITINSGYLNMYNSNFTGMTLGNINIAGGTLNLSGGVLTGLNLGSTSISVTSGILEVNPSTFPVVGGAITLGGGVFEVNGGIYSGSIGTGNNQLNMTSNSSALSGAGTGASSGTLQLNVGGTPDGQLIWTGATGATPGFIVGGTLTLGANSATDNTTLVNPMDLDSTGTRVIKIGANGQSLTTLSGSISDSLSGGGLQFGAANNTNQGYIWVMMSGGESYTGSTVIGATTSGTVGNNNPLRLILAGSGSYSSSTYAITGTVGGQLGINQAGTAYVSGNIITLTGTDDTTDHYTYDIGATVVIGGSSTVNGVSGSSGLVVFTGANTYVGNTNIDSGTLQIGNGGTAGQLPASLTGTVAGLAHTALVYDLTSSSVTVDNPMSGAMGFTQAGTGLVILNNGVHQLYTGTTTISSGTLQFGDGTTDGLTSSNSPVIANSGVLVLNNIGTETYSGSIGGTGSLTKSAAGNEILSGNMGYSGTTGINAGTLTLSGSNNNATAITVNNNGTLVLGGTNAIKGAASLTLNSGGTMNLALGGTTHIINMAGNAGNALVLTGGTMNFGMGTNTADELVLGAGSVSMSGIITITATGYGTIALTTPQALIYAPGGGLVAADFTAPTLSGATFTVTSGTLFLSTGVTITTAYWKGNNGTNWSADNTWTSDQAGTTASTTGPTSSLAIVFSANGATNEGSTVMDQDTSATSLTINSANTVGIGGTHTLTLSSNSAIVTSSTAGATTIGANINLTGALPSISANSSNPLTISGTIEGSTTGLQVIGTGLVALTGANTYTGTINITSGTVQINNASSLGASTNAVTFTGGTSGYLQVAPSVGTLTDPHNIAFSNIGVASTVDNNGNVLVLSGSVTGSGTYVSAGSGTTQLTGVVSGYTGNISVTAGEMETGNGGTGGALSATPAITVAAGAALAIDLSGVTNFTNSIAGSGTLIQSGPATSNLEINATENISNYIVNSGTLDMLAHPFNNSTTPTGSITVNAGGVFLINIGDMIGGSSAATPNLTINLNGGTLQQNSTETNIGVLNMSSGTLIINGGGNANFPAFSVRGPTITVNGSGESFINSTSATNQAYGFRLSGSDTSSLDITTFNVASTGAAGGIDLSVSALLADGWAVGTQNVVNSTFIKTGAGVMQLSGSNVWGGGTQINGGVLLLNNVNALPTLANVTADKGGLSTGTLGAISFGGGTLEYSSNNNVDYSANFSTAASQAFSINTNGQNVTYATGLSSSGGTLTKLGSGTLTLNGVSSYTGLTTVGNGSLYVNGSIAASSGVVVSSGAKLGGSGVVSNISGNGNIAPSDGPSILTATSITPGANMSFTFQFSTPASGGPPAVSAPNYAASSASGNDVLHLTGLTSNSAAPLSGLSLGAGNTITIDFTPITGSLAIGQVYQGGFFLDDNTVTNASFSNANFVYVGTGGATIQYDGLVAITTADFATGTVTNGEEMQFEVIPEPGTYAMIFSGFGMLIGFQKFRRGTRKKK